MKMRTQASSGELSVKRLFALPNRIVWAVLTENEVLVDWPTSITSTLTRLKPCFKNSTIISSSLRFPVS